VSLPIATVEPGATVAVPIVVESKGKTLRSAEVAFTCEPAVLSLIEGSAARGSSVAGDWLLVVNSSTPGTVRLAMAGVTAASVSGGFVSLTFHAVRGRGSSTALSLASIGLDEGAAASAAANGHAALEVRFRRASDFVGDFASDTLWRGSGGDLWL